MHNRSMSAVSMGTATPSPAAGDGQTGWPSELWTTLDRARYRLQQQSLAVWLGLSGRVWSLIVSPGQKLDRTAMALLQRRYTALLDRDLDNVAAGAYPRALLYQFPLASYLRCVPEALMDLPRFLWRSFSGQYDDLPADVDRRRYPRYYLRTFHWQTDGWLSPRSARLYDASVEFLFGGTADVMRRMALPPVVESVRGVTRPRILDVACGTGRFLLQLHRTLPDAKLYGLDLSPYYLAHASELLAGVDVSLVVDNAETMPLADGLFDAVTSVFLFHELPSNARRRVMCEAWRVLKPGGRMVICDSAQLSDSRELQAVLLGFAAAYHEPYFKGYLRDDLATLMRQCGFEVESSAPHLVSKVVVGRKPKRRRVRAVGDAARG